MALRPEISLVILLLLTETCLLTGCGQTSSSSKPGSEMTEQDINKEIQFLPATQAESESLIKSVDAAVAHVDTATLNALLDEQQVIDRVLAGLDVPSDFRTGFTKGMREGGGLPRVSTEIISAVQQGGSYSFVRMVQRGNEYRPLYRLALPNSGGINYHELIVSGGANKQPRIADIYVFLSGEPLSQTIRRLVLPTLATQNSGILARLTGTESAFVKNISTIEKINNLNQAQQHAEAFKLFAMLPQSLQNDKTILLMKLGVSQRVSDADYIQVIQDIERHYPNDPSRDFRAIDLFAMQGKHEELVKAVDRLMATTEDRYLNLLKANSLVALGRTDDALKAMAETKAVADDIDIYWTEIGVLLTIKDHPGTARVLDQIAEKFGMTFNDLSATPEYADFAASEEGIAWMAQHPATPAEPALDPDNPAP